MTEKPSRGTLRPLLSGVILRSQTDERLFALAGAGNEQAFGAIFERYRRELRAHASRVVRADQADDVVQQAMIGAWTALLAGTRVADVRPWLHRVVHNAALDTVTKRGYDDGELPASSVSTGFTDERAEVRLKAEEALAALAALPESQRRAMTLTAIEGRSGRDAALAMGISESAMRQLVHRARSGMRTAVTAITPMPLFELLGGVGGAPATPAIAGLGAAGGGAAIAKIAAVVGASAVTLGAANAIRPHHGSAHARPLAAAAAQAGRHAPEHPAATPAIRQAGVGGRRTGGGASVVGSRLAPHGVNHGRHKSTSEHGGGGDRAHSDHHESSATGLDTGLKQEQNASAVEHSAGSPGLDQAAASGVDTASPPQTAAHESSVPAWPQAANTHESPTPQSTESRSGN